MAEKKTPGNSMAVKMEVVCPNDTNPLGILQGGRLVQWMDLACAICAQNHAGFICVTASIDSVSFKTPAQNGDIITIQCKVTKVFRTSMEIHAVAWKKNTNIKRNVMINEAFFTFVAIDDDGRPLTIPPVAPVTKEEKEAFNNAGKRRAKRIINDYENVTGKH